MAINRWIAQATAVSQVDTFTPAVVAIGDIFTLTTSGFDGTSNEISYTAVDTSATTVSGALIVLWNNSLDSLNTGMTATGTATVILTADVAGVAFKVASSATGVAPTFTRVATTANGGPLAWDDPDNWSEGTIPGATASEDTYVENATGDILYGLDQSGASQTLNSLHISKDFSGLIGHDGATGLVGDYLQLKTSKAFIGEWFKSTRALGSSRIKIDYGTTASAIIVYYTASSADGTKPAYRMIANSGSTLIREIRQGSVGVASQTGETTTLDDIQISYNTSPQTDATLEIGSGVTMGDLECVGGETSVACTVGTIDAIAGTVIISGTGTITTLNVSGGKAVPVSTGLITTCNITNGECDFVQSADPRTVTTINLDTLGVLKLDPSVVTVTNKIIPNLDGRIQYRASGV